MGSGHMPNKKVAFTTFGCRLNQYDTETIRTLLERDGRFDTVARDATADVVVVNTCTVTSRADASARKAIRRIHRDAPTASIVVTGCYAQRAPHELAALPGVRLVVGAADRAQIAHKIGSLEAVAQACASPEIAVSPISEARTFIDVPITEMMEHSRAYVKVQEGCNESCSFCIVPSTRGSSRSRTRRSVIEQIRSLLDSGYSEIVLTGVHLGDYGRDLPGHKRQLSELIEEILAFNSLKRFRLSSIEPASIDDRLIELMSREPRFARHFHIPFQSGSDRILSRMRRRYRAEQFEQLINRIAEKVPMCGIGCDVICGFPGETADDFKATFEMLERLPVTYVHAFSYSPRPGSEAEQFGDDVPADLKKRRISALKRLVREKGERFKARHVGMTLQVIAETTRRAGVNRLAGWTDNYLRVDLGIGHKHRELVRARITGYDDEGLHGQILDSA